MSIELLRKQILEGRDEDRYEIDDTRLEGELFEKHLHLQKNLMKKSSYVLNLTELL